MQKTLLNLAKNMAKITTVLVAILFAFSVIPTQTLAEDGQGSLTVCRMFVDSTSGNIVTSSLPQSTFVISISTSTSISNNIAYSFAYNSNLPMDFSHLFNTDCSKKTVPFGEYYYSADSIVSNTNFNTAYYNDKLTTVELKQLISNDLIKNEVYPYSSEFLDNDQYNDMLANINADGKVIVSAENPDRVIFVSHSFNSKSQASALSCTASNQTIFSDTTDQVDGHNAVATGFTHPSWTANIPGATWIWSTPFIEDPFATTTKTFTKTFNVSGSVTSAVLDLATDDIFKVFINGNLVNSNQTYGTANFTKETQVTLDVKQFLVTGTNTIAFEVTNYLVPSRAGEVKGPMDNPGALLYKLSISTESCPLPNKAPTIALNGLGLVNLTVEDVFNDPMASATDTEDGDLTNKIVVTGKVDTTKVGTYTIAYSVKDSGGLEAITYRTVVVNPAKVQLPQCLPLTIDSFSTKMPHTTQIDTGINKNSASVVTGDDLGGELDIYQTLTAGFSANTGIDPDPNTGLNFGAAYGLGDKGHVTLTWDGVDNSTNLNYTGLNNTDLTFGGQKEMIKFNYSADFVDNKNIPVKITVYSDANNSSSITLSLYGGMNSLETAEAKFADFTKVSGNGADFSKVGAIVMEFDMTSRDGFDFLLGKIETPCKPTPNQCALPQITSALLATAIINTPFTYSFTATSTIATSTTPTISLDASKLPTGLTYSEVTKKITGIPTVGGTFNIPLTATNSCGVDNKTLVLVVNGGQCIAPKITSALTATGKVGQLFSYEVSSNAGVVTVSTSTLPAGLTFSTTTNKISGTPTTAGTYNVEVKASNSCGTDTRTVVITISPADTTGNQCVPLAIDSFSIQSVNITQIDPTKNLNKTFGSVQLSDKISGELDVEQILTKGLSGKTGINTGTVYDLNFGINFGSGDSGIVKLTYDGLDNSPAINYTGLNNLDLTGNGTKDMIRFNYLPFLNASSTGIKTKITVYSDANNSSSITLNLLGNTMATAEAKFANFTKVSGNGADFSKVGAIVVEFDFTSADGQELLVGKIETPCKPTQNQCALPQLTSNLLATGIVGQTFTYTITATTTTATSTVPVISFTGSLPAGLTYSTTTNTISGTPTTAGEYTLNLKATNSCGTDEKTLKITITGSQCVLPELTSALTAKGKVGQEFSYSAFASSGTIEVTSSTLPVGLTFSTTTNKISGTPTKEGVYNVEFKVTNSCGNITKIVVITVDPVDPPQTPVGKITFCMLFGNQDNVLYKSASGLPEGSFSINLATSTSFATSTLKNKTWNTTAFAPNRKVVSSAGLDAECITYDNLPLGMYYYSELAKNGSLWNIPTYSDQYNQPVNSIFDLFKFDVSNVNADGKLDLSNDRREHTVIMYVNHNPPTQCTLPSVTSSLSATGKVGQAFSYVFTASNTTSMLVSTSTLPAGLTYSTTTNTISGTPTTSGTYNVELKASNSCGTDTRTVVITIEPADINQCLLPQLTSGLRQEITVGQTLSYQLVASSTSSVTITVATSSMPSWMSYSTTTKTFSGRPVDTGTYNIKVTLQNSCGVKEETITIVVSPTPPGGGGGCSGNCTTPTPGPITGGGGGNGPIVPNPTSKPEAPNSCYYLFDHLKKGWNNNPVEVKKLQVFLRDLEGFNVEITGVYDDQTINAVNAFQLRYRDDILTPWGHTAPTSFTYITTKKKVNEIYCKKAFPVTVQEQNEIDAYRNFLAELNRQGITITRPTNTIPVIVVPENIPEINEVGFIETNRNDLTTGAGVSTTTEEISNNLLASVIGSAKGLGNFLGSIISWPYNWIKGLFDRDEVGQCGQVNNCCCCNNGGIDSWFTWLLLIIIAILLYQIYREKKLYRKMMEANQELEMANKSNNLG